MIKRVIGPDGDVWHDCDDAGCDVSWDGVTIANGKPAAGRPPIAQTFDVDADRAELIRIKARPTRPTA